jgi:hypothetical protein
MPDFLLMVMSPVLPRARWKPDAWNLARRADVVVLNTHGAGEEDLRRLGEEVAGARGGRIPALQDVSRPLAEWIDREPFDALARLLGPPAGRPG